MFETIGTLISIFFWGTAILVSIGWVVCVIQDFASGDGWKFVKGITSVVLGAIVFYYSITWLSSFLWAMLFGGGVGFGIAVEHSENETHMQRAQEKQPGILSQIADQVIQDEHDIAIVREANRRDRENL